MNSSGRVCFEWQRTGQCSRGSRCKFHHNQATGTATPRNQGTCHEWTRTGRCRFGSSCRFRHGNSQTPNRNISTAVKKSNQNDLARFLQHLSAVKAEAIGSELCRPEAVKVWIRCWNEHDTLPTNALSSLIEVLAKLPGSAADHPPPSRLEEASIRFLQIKASSSESKDQVLTAVKTAYNALKRCLLFDWRCERNDIKSCLSKIILEADSKLKRQDKDHRLLSNQLMNMHDDLDVPWRLNLADVFEEKETSIIIGEETVAQYDQWETATVKWLMNPDFFSPAKCPVMKSTNNGVYESKDAYLDCIHRLWVAMTFNDGHGALAPHCRSRSSSGMVCGNGLWPMSGSSTAKGKCRTNLCRNPVEYCCRMKGHDALCAQCAQDSIQKHLGPAGKAASTHVYDCKVKSVESNGKVFLQDFKCRNPPLKPIHWRTTKRLSPPSLVGIVLLRSPGSSLKESDRVIWAEIVPHGDPRDEDRRRGYGDLALNIASVVEFDSEYFEADMHVAVIDCLGFVPEWVPVLQAISQQKQNRLPFNDGADLNLAVTQPNTSVCSILDEVPQESLSSTTPKELIHYLVENSVLEPIREIRRDDVLREQLISGLTRLAISTTLDRMQLVSFVDGLLNPVHLTQGPPGTGKSYLGVVLVRALIIIRTLWLKKSKSAAASPILVLSYKNHAIDEFLADLVQAEPSLTRHGLIRIGGKSKDSRLAPFSERNVSQSDPDVLKAKTIADSLNVLRDSIQVTYETEVCSFLSYKTEILQSKNSRDRKQIVNKAVEILMRCIIRMKLIDASVGKQQDEEGSGQPSHTVAHFSYLRLDNGSEPSPVLRKAVGNWDGSAFVTELINGMTHYGDEHWGDVLVQWLENKMPRPKCCFASCVNLTISPDVISCDLHTCVTVENGIRCARICNGDNSSYCDLHCCKVDGCCRSLQANQQFCSNHCCKQCVALGRIASLAIDMPPCNVCDDHPLCLSMACVQSASEGSDYCIPHQRIECQALTKKGKPCKGLPLSRLFPFCLDHRSLAPQVANTSENSTEPERQTSSRCEFQKRNGGQCKGRSITGTRLCYDHTSSVTPPRSSGDDKQGEEIAKHPIPEEGEESERNLGSLVPTISEIQFGNVFCREVDGDHTASPIQDDGDDEGDCTQRSQLNNTPNKPLQKESGSHENQDDQSFTSLDEGEAVNTQHLREVFEVEEALEIFEEPPETSIEITTHELGSESRRGVGNPQEWTWSMTETDRWDSCLLLMQQLAASLVEISQAVKKSTSQAQKDLQQAIIRAKARAYEQKIIVGGTLVGCISRLDSIRKTRPFAVVCEEASEVLEPLLFSCLSESTMKLEMIGDHLQLSPSVMDRYEFEVINRVNLSLFERLIRAPPGHEVSSTVLSVQRRMRKNICDLTREFYKDVTKIEDHDKCGSQGVGERSVLKHKNQFAGAREIPGVAPHIYLWTHNGKQERARVGVSRMNSHEASLACNLAAYLVECGVPRTSIVILTPYKGQLLEMRNMLFKEARLKSLRLLSKDPSRTDVIRLSTVDRFQGDEEDIVIASLVVDADSKTGFVKLVNRMIVLLSRARLGLYLLGNVGYFESNGLPNHWAETFNLLQESRGDDSNKPARDLFVGARIGSELPICCPLHRSAVSTAANSAELKTGFCRERCTHILSCGHQCSLPCHCLSPDNHSKRCSVLLSSLCERHPKQIMCNVAYSNASPGNSHLHHTEIMQHFRCKASVKFDLQCGHSKMLPCHEEREISSGESKEPLCREKSLKPFVFPLCGHSRTTTCEQFAEFSSRPDAVKCEEQADYEGVCGHHHTLVCWRVPAEPSLFHCNKKTRIRLPRCGHEHNVPCNMACQLRSWTGRSCDTVGVIVEGENYGGNDFSCQEAAQLVKPCGHKFSMKCSEAFAQASSPRPCQKVVDTTHPHCGHAAQLKCHLVDDVLAEAPTVVVPQEIYREGIPPPTVSLSFIVPPCKKKVEVQRSCGHTTEIACGDIRKPLLPCKHAIGAKSSLCGHNVNTQCHLSAALKEKIWDAETLEYITRKECIPAQASFVADRRSLAQLPKKYCERSIGVTLACGHLARIPCAKLPAFLTSSNGSAKTQCKEDTVLELHCGHKVDVPCYQATAHKSGACDVSCVASKTVKCWNHEVCMKTALSVPCTYKGSATCSQPSLWTCSSESSHVLSLNLCSESVPLDCPECTRDSIILGLQNPKSYQELLESLKSAFECIDHNHVEWLSEPQWDSETKLLHRRINVQSKLDLCRPQPIFHHQRVLCFRVLKNKHKSCRRFEPKKFVNKHRSLYGLQTRVLSRENLELLTDKVDGKTRWTLLIGLASVVQTKTLDSTFRMPSEPNDVQNFVVALNEDSFDSVRFHDKVGFDTLIVWEPFPILAVCRMELTAIDISSIRNLPSVSSLEPTYISFSDKPNGHLPGVVVDSEVPPDESDEGTETGSDDSFLLLRNSLSGTALESFCISEQWSGGIDELSGPVEDELLRIMEFTNRSARPFASINRLRSFLQDTSHPVCTLLLAIETLRYDFDGACALFDEYLALIRANGPSAVHPWALIAAARVEPKSAARYLHVYNETFPLLSRFMSESERALVQNGANSMQVSLPSPRELMVQEWEQIQSDHNVTSNATDKLLSLVGLSKVKREVISIWKTSMQLQRMSEDKRRRNMITTNYCFVCRLFAEILFDCGVRQKDRVVETTAQKLKDGGSQKLQELLSLASGGVLFIDEAYDLDPKDDFKGRPIVNELLTICENQRRELSVVIAGYRDDLQKKLFDYNNGLKSRFQEIVFDDFDEADLKTIWTTMRNDKGWEEAEEVASVASRRLARASGRKGFGNAREVRSLLESAVKAALSRIGDDFSESSMIVEIEDVIGEDPRLSSTKLQSVVCEFDQKIGWKRVKEKAKELLDICGMNYQRELRGKPPLPITLNRLFLGNPGTGKTTCAQLYGRLLKELGFLSSGEVVAKTASDFVGSVIGASQTQTRQILDSAKGRVLIIDEAYALDDGQFGKQVLDTIVEKIQGGSNDDIAVLLLGYEAEMMKMLSENNPGLSRRFPKEHAFFFDDYDDSELLEILDLNIRKQEINATMAYKEKALDILRSQKRQANFGNAGAVEQLVKASLQNACKRDAGQGLVLQGEDIEDPGSARSVALANPLGELDNLYKMEAVRDKIAEIKSFSEVSKRDGEEEPDLGHFVFLGAPGTGKTTVARTLGNILHSLKLKPSNICVETSALELTGDYVGQTKTKVEKLLKESKGGILFIDEAYQLGEGQFGKEACDALVAAMTNESFRDVTIVIAGYAKEINNMLNSNSGLKSRFTSFFEFPEWEASDCVAFFASLATKEDFSVEPEATDSLSDGCRRLRQLKGFGNGRDVKELWKQSKQKRALRIYSSKSSLKTIVEADVSEAIRTMVQARIGKIGEKPTADPLAALDKLFRMGEIKRKIEKLKKELIVARQEGGDVPAIGHFVFTGSPGTGKTTVARAIASILFGLELKPSDKIVETTALDMTGDYIGHTVTKVNGLLDEAKGGILFIDEAYSFESSFGQEAIDTIVAAMTSEEYKDVQIVIAGYPREIHDMFRKNSGLKSRFTHFFEFPNWSAADCATFFSLRAERAGFSEPLDVGLLDCVSEACAKLIPLDGWANGRDVVRLFDEAVSNRSERVFENPEPTRKLTLNDVEQAAETVLNARRPPGGYEPRVPTIDNFQPTAAANNQGPPLVQAELVNDATNVQPSVEIDAQQVDAATEHQVCSDERIVTEDGASVEQCSDEESQTSTVDENERDPGVSDAVWDELQRAKREERQQVEEIRRIEEELETQRREEEEARLLHEAELRRIEEQRERELRREVEEIERRRQEEAERRRIEKEERLRCLREKQRRIEAVRNRLRSTGPCPAGFVWHKTGNGWRCGGGTHFVSDAELQSRYGMDI